MNPKYTYLLVLVASIAGPLLLSFDRKVAFYKSWRYLFAAMILPAAFYIGWDAIFTKHGVWSFNPKYVIGIYFFGLPLEEILFFFAVPYCCVFIYECVRIYFPKLTCTRNSDLVLLATGFIVFVLSIIFFDRKYTGYTGLFCSIFIFVTFFFRKFFQSFNSKVFLVSYLIVLIPFLAVNGVLTALPVVLYNNAENLSLRIYTIPVEDIFYGMLLVMMNVVIFEKARRNVEC